MVSYVNLFENEDFMMRLLAGEFDSAIKKGKMKMEPVFYNKDEYNEADSIEETVEVEETQKCTDIEKAMAVLDGSNKDMAEEDFTEETWAEANEKYYSMDDMDYKEEVSPEGETVITMSGERLIDFLMDRADTVSTWDDDEEASDEYIYEDDEVNVNEECDATILSFAKAFSCMSNKAEEVAPTSEPVLETKSRLDTLLDIIIENQEEFHDRYERSYANMDGDYKSYKKCPNCYDLESIGLEANDLSDKVLACALYKDLRYSSLIVSDAFINKNLGKELFTRDDLLEILIEGIDDYYVDQYIDFCGIEDDVRALTRAVA